MNYRNNWGRYLIAVEVAVLILVLVFGVVRFILPDNKNSRNNNGQPDSEMIYNQTVGDTESDGDSNEINNINTQIEPVAFSDDVNAKIQSMSVEQKVCQLFITRPEEITGVSQFTQAGAKTKQAMSQYPLGGFVFSDSNFKATAANKNMMANIQKYANEQQGLNMFLAVSKSDNTAGFMTDNALNMGIGISADTVSEYSGAGVYTALTGFPGENVTELPSIEDTVKQNALSGATAMVIDNFACEALTGDANMPCSVSVNSVGYLRNTAGFNGIIMTSDLSSGLPDGYGAPQASVEAVKAGVSMVWVSTGFNDCYTAVLDAANSGEITEETLNQAVGRVLTIKMS